MASSASRLFSGLFLALALAPFLEEGFLLGAALAWLCLFAFLASRCMHLNSMTRGKFMLCFLRTDPELVLQGNELCAPRSAHVKKQIVNTHCIHQPDLAMARLSHNAFFGHDLFVQPKMLPWKMESNGHLHIRLFKTNIALFRVHVCTRQPALGGYSRGPLTVSPPRCWLRHSWQPELNNPFSVNVNFD